MKESDFQQVLGVSRDKLRWLRRGLVEGTHFVREGRSVVYTAEGEAEVRGRIAEELGAGQEREAESQESRAESPELRVQSTEPEVAAVIEELRVLKRVLNPKIVLCSRAGDSLQHRVIVRSSLNFLPGMTLRARLVRGERDLWELQGRCPRWRGRW